MPSAEVHNLIRDIYSVDYSADSTADLLDRLVHQMGVPMAVIGYSDHLSGRNWDTGSATFRTWRDTRTEDFIEHFTRFSDIYGRLPARAHQLGAEQFFQADELFDAPGEQDRIHDCLQDIRTKVGFASYFGGAISAGGSETGFVGVCAAPGEEQTARAALEQQAFWLTHLSGASALHRRIRRLGMVEMVLDKLKWGVVLLDDQSRVVYSNEAARRIMDKNPALSIRAGRLKGPSGLLRGLASCGPAQGPGIRRNHLDVLAEDPETVDCVVFATAYRDPHHALSDESGGTLLFLHDTSPQLGDAVSAAAQLHGLTTAERECLDLLVQGMSRDSVAQIREVSPETVKSQVGQILQKLSCRRQSEVVARVALFDPPFTAG